MQVSRESLQYLLCDTNKIHRMVRMVEPFSLRYIQAKFDIKAKIYMELSMVLWFSIETFDV